MRVYVLLYNAGTDNEGIHTLRLRQGEGESPDYRNVILMFESEEDAIRYGIMLEAQDFSAPLVECLDIEDVQEFCEAASYDCVMVPEGTLTLPPETNLDQTDWTPEGTPNASEASGASETADAEPVSSFSSDELDQLRRRLEGLL
ncbi:MAG: DUF3110 domain-containing protein [Kaiparowitsia implicata GSE-PSE-MK54-09C]|jgi:hypothetical protein|nr:DUF3110 domain-containing protein [Kaiparowitsia implicata GSE-PSE-MK54-09C]